MHTTHVLRLSENLPIVIEVVDTAGKIDGVLPEIEKMIGDGLITMQELSLIHI